MSNIAFIGLGNMGSGMCANLAKAGHQVRAFDLNTQSVDNAVQAGALAATSIAQCVSDAEYVITMLPAGKHVHAVYFNLLISTKDFHLIIIFYFRINNLNQTLSSVDKYFNNSLINENI